VCVCVLVREVLENLLQFEKIKGKT